jgi:proline iminopeptidase
MHWSESGNPEGKPALVLHGGPGSGSSPRHRRLFDPQRYRIIQFDQRNCGQSTPFAGEPHVDLSTNTTKHLIEDIERLRLERGIERWLVWGRSWGSALGIAYAQAHPDVVSELLVTAVGAGNSDHVEWITRTMGRIFPEAWNRFRDHLPPERRDGNLVKAYNDLVINPDPDIHHPAALAWCRWEDTHMSLTPGYQPHLSNAEPTFRLCFARLVTPYWANAFFLDENHLLDNADKLANTPTYISHGRLDISSPSDFPVALAAAIPNAELLITDQDGHGGTNMWEWTASIVDRLAGPHDPDASSSPTQSQ